MHDGSLKTIEEVIEHYDNKAKKSPNRDGLIRKLQLTPYHKKALIAFLNTLTDTSYLNNPLIVK
jgi:cytochrome c peroxidase